LAATPGGSSTGTVRATRFTGLRLAVAASALILIGVGSSATFRLQKVATNVTSGGGGPAAVASAQASAQASAPSTTTTSADFRFLPALPVPPVVPPPVATLDVGLTPDGTVAPATATVAIGWHGPDQQPIAHGVEIQVTEAGGGPRSIRIGDGTTAITANVKAGRDYVYRLSTTPSAGSPGPAGTIAFQLQSVDDGAKAVTYAGRWQVARSSGYQGGTIHVASAAKATATFAFTGRSVAWIGPVGPGRGSAAVEVDGGKALTVSSAASVSRPRQILFARSWPDVGRHIIRITVGSGNRSVAVVSFSVVTAPRNPVEDPTTAPDVAKDATLPIRATFYYPWYPEAWTSPEGASNFHPVAGSYDESDPAVIREQIAAMRYGGIQAAIASWWGTGTRTDGRIGQLLAASKGTGLAWAVDVGAESIRDPDVATIRSTLHDLANRYGKDPSYLRIQGRFVVFVAAGPNDGCDLADRWTSANDVRAYLVLAAVPGAGGCDRQPDDWYAADPTVADQAIGSSSYAISPGFWRVGEAPRLDRDPVRWTASVKAMVASGARFQIAGTFNEWADGSSIEAAHEWPSDSGYGTYLDILHANTAGGSAGGGSSGSDPVLVGAGAIASCGSTNDDDTARLVSSIPGTVFTVGDNALENGSEAEFRECFEPTWGAFRDRTRPAVGSRDYLTPGAAAYFSYFGTAAGDPGKGWYAYDLGSWRIYVLNSNCAKIGGCQRGSPQERWLRADLAAHRNACVGAYWHTARFSSGRFDDDLTVEPFWDDLYAAGAEFVISGHDHNYQRYAPLTPTGQIDRAKGIREFVVGTGGAGHTALVSDPTGRREAGTDAAFGVLRLTLHPTGYEWQFVATSKAPFDDSGAASCH
jgi:hypothetical protein